MEPRELQESTGTLFPSVDHTEIEAFDLDLPPEPVPEAGGLGGVLCELE